MRRSSDGVERAKAAVWDVLNGRTKVSVPSLPNFRAACAEIALGLGPDEERAINERLASIFPVSSLVGHAVRKPYGYAGDFELADKILEEYLCPQPWFGSFDALFQRTAVAKATRARARYFVDEVMRLAEKNGGNLDVLYVSVGTGRDVLAAARAANIRGFRLRFMCLDVDPNALSFAKRTLLDAPVRLRFAQADGTTMLKVLRGKRFDFVWCGGQQSMQADEALVRTLRNCFAVTKKLTGHVTLPCYTATNEDAMLRLFLGLHLQSRTGGEMIDLVRRAGMNLEDGCQREVRSDAGGNNLYLCVRRAGGLGPVGATARRPPPLPARAGTLRRPIKQLTLSRFNVRNKNGGRGKKQVRPIPLSNQV